MHDKIKFYTSKTLECWDEVADLHAVQNSSLAEHVVKPDFNALEKDFDRTKYQAKENYYFHHTLSDVLMASINNGLVPGQPRERFLTSHLG